MDLLGSRPLFGSRKKQFGSTSGSNYEQINIAGERESSGMNKVPTQISNSNLVTDDCIVCNCNKPAIKLTVRKEGVNQGRPFWKCSNDGACNFFLWDDTDQDVGSGPPPTAPNPGLVTNSRQQTQGKTCSKCGSQARVFTTKNGKNAGKMYWSCPREGGCGEWLGWADENSDNYSATTSRDFGGGTSNSNSSSVRPGFLGGGHAIGEKGRGRGIKRKSTGSDGPGGKQRKCGICGQPGHNRKNCPNQ